MARAAAIGGSGSGGRGGALRQTGSAAWATQAGARHPNHGGARRFRHYGVTVTASETQPLSKLKAFGFMGIMVQGSHHHQHHLMIAAGQLVH